MNALARVLYVIVGIVNLIPVSGALSTGRLRALYGISLVDPNLIVLMRHRAALFGIVGALLIAAAFHRPLRVAASIAGLFSMLSFVAIAYAVGGFGAELRNVVVADLFASFLLVVASAAAIRSDSRDAAS